MNKNPYSYKRKRRAPSTKKIVLTVIIAFIAALALIIAGAVYVSSAHTDPATGLQYKISPNSFTCRIVSAAKCEESEIKVPEKIGLYTVTEISGSAFARIDGLKKVEIPETVTKIDVSAFYESKNLEEVKLPSGITEIAPDMFFGCKSLKTIAIPDSVTYIGTSAFEESGLTEIHIGENIKFIDNWAFSECFSLTEIEIPGTVEKLGQGAVHCCNSLESIVIGEGIEEIPDSFIFSGVNLKKAVFPKSIKSIGTNIFMNGGPSELTYLGTVEEWCDILKAEDWSRYIIIHCTDGSIDSNGYMVED